MRNDDVVKRERQFCPFCEEEHEVLLIKSKQTATIKNEIVECETLSYLCEAYQESFENGELADQNLQAFKEKEMSEEYKNG